MTHVHSFNSDGTENNLEDKAKQMLGGIAQAFVDKAGDPLWENCLDWIKASVGEEAHDLANCDFIKNVFFAGLMSGYVTAVNHAAEMESVRKQQQQKDAIGDVFNHVLKQSQN